MKLNSILKPNNSVFNKLVEIDPTKYEECFDDMDPLTLDLDFFSRYGERTVAPLVKSFVREGVLVSDGMGEIAKLLWFHYYHKWKQISQALTTEYDVLSPYNIEEDTTEDKSYEADNESNNTTDNNTYGYGSIDAINDNDTKSRDVGHTTSKTGTLKKYIRKGNIGNTSYSELIQKELDARKTTFLDTVFADICETMTLKIYE